MLARDAVRNAGAVGITLVLAQLPPSSVTIDSSNPMIAPSIASI
jgi:hypothetical protein